MLAKWVNEGMLLNKALQEISVKSFIKISVTENIIYLM